jgi:uncharacterized protein (TIGR02677 family)
MRFIYQEYQRLNYWLRPEQVYEGVMAWNVINDYTLEQCQIDLEKLSEWGNLSSRHDSGNALTVEEYLRKKYQYLISPYSIEIERLLENLESLHGYGGSLEPTLFDTIADILLIIHDKSGPYSEKEALGLWNTLQETFQKLYKTSADYIASLYTERAESLMATDSFLLYKDSLTAYLKDFVQTLQRRSYKIEGYLQQIHQNKKDSFLQSVVDDEWKIPKLESTISKEEYMEELSWKWDSLYRWFYGESGSSSEMLQLEHASKEAIIKIVRSALRIQERKRSAINRRRELDYLGKWFYQIDKLEDAHRLAAHVFGLFRTRHLQGEDVITSDSNEKSMWKEPTNIRILRSRSRKKNERQESEVVVDHSLQKRLIREKFLKKQKREFEFLVRMVEMGSFSISEIGQASAEMRLQILYWISRCTLAPELSYQTPEGVRISLEVPPDSNRTILKCEDGSLELLNYRFLFSLVNRTAWETHLLWLNNM